MGLVAISAFFIALVMLFGFRIDRNDATWRVIEIPESLWISTIVLACSSAALELGRYHLRRARVGRYRLWLAIAVVGALSFLILQFQSAAVLLRQGINAEANPQGFAFYIFIAIHGMHLLGGLIWLVYLLVRSGALGPDEENAIRRHRRVGGAAAIYWHYMGAVWLVLFAFLLTWTR